MTNKPTDSAAATAPNQPTDPAAPPAPTEPTDPAAPTAPTAPTDQSGAHAETHSPTPATLPSAHRFQGAHIPTSPFADDDGSADPELVAALVNWQHTGSAAEAVAALIEARLLVALVAVLDSVEAGVEKDSHMAAARLVRPDGKSALLAFTSVASAQNWQADVRPLPVTAVDVARAAITDGTDAVLIDGTWALTGPILWAVAERRVPVAPINDAAVTTCIREIVAEISAQHQLPRDITFESTGEADILVLVDPAFIEQADALRLIAQKCAEAPILRTRLLRGLQFGVSAPAQ